MHKLDIKTTEAIDRIVEKGGTAEVKEEVYFDNGEKKKRVVVLEVKKHKVYG